MATIKKRILISAAAVLALAAIAFGVLACFFPFAYAYALDGVMVDHVHIWAKMNTTLTVPEQHDGQKVVQIRGGAFAGCSRLRELNLPETVDDIGGGAFTDCIELKTLRLPAAAEYAFRIINKGGEIVCEGSAINDFQIGENDHHVVAIDGVLYEGKEGDRELLCCPPARVELIPPAGIVGILPHAFAYNVNLHRVELPAGVKRIGFEAFLGCTQLESVTLPDSVTEIGSRTFSECMQLKELKIPESVTGIGAGAFSYETTLLVYPGSAAEQYAENNDYTYEVIDEAAA